MEAGFRIFEDQLCLFLVCSCCWLNFTESSQIFTDEIHTAVLQAHWCVIHDCMIKEPALVSKLSEINSKTLKKKTNKQTYIFSIDFAAHNYYLTTRSHLVVLLDPKAIHPPSSKTVINKTVILK